MYQVSQFTFQCLCTRTSKRIFFNFIRNFARLMALGEYSYLRVQFYLHVDTNFTSPLYSRLSPRLTTSYESNRRNSSRFRVHFYAHVATRRFQTNVKPQGLKNYTIRFCVSLARLRATCHPTELNISATPVYFDASSRGEIVRCIDEARFDVF